MLPSRQCCCQAGVSLHVQVSEHHQGFPEQNTRCFCSSQVSGTAEPKPRRFRWMAQRELCGSGLMN